MAYAWEFDPVVSSNTPPTDDIRQNTSINIDNVRYSTMKLAPQSINATQLTGFYQQCQNVSARKLEELQSKSPQAKWYVVVTAALLILLGATWWYRRRQLLIVKNLASDKLRPAFTLIELLVTLAIISLMMAMILPAIQRVREFANKIVCASNIRQLVLAVHNYETQFKRLPYGQIGPTGPTQPPPPPGQPYYGWGPTSKGWSWLTRLLPFIEQDNLYIQGGVGTKTLEQSGICAERIPIYLCPSDTAYYAAARTDAGNLMGFPVGHTNYKGVRGSNWGYDGTQGFDYPTPFRN